MTVQETSGTADAGHALIVDDDDPIRKVLVRCLQSLGWTVEDVNSAEKGLGLLQAPGAEERYNVVLCDLTMPGIGGAGLCRTLAEHSPRMLSKVIIMTGNSGGPSAELRSFGFNSVLQKPFPMRLLIERLAAMQTQRS